MRAVDLFAGAGGFSLGLMRAGFDVVLSNEFSVDPEWSYRQNILHGAEESELPPRPTAGGPRALRRHRQEVRQAILLFRKSHPDDLTSRMRGGDIKRAMRSDWLREWKSTQPGEIDVLVAGPPCQGFSTAGLQETEDERNLLVREAVRVASVLQPRVVVIENVPGMLTGHSELVLEVGRRLTRMKPGYCVTVELLHGVRLGVPQTRRRLLLVAVRRDLLDAGAHGRLRSRVFPPKCPDTSPRADQLREARPVAYGSSLTAEHVLGDLLPYPPKYETTSEALGYRSDARLNAFRREMRTCRDEYLSGGLSLGSQGELIPAHFNHESSVHTKNVRMRLKKLRSVARRTQEGRAHRCSSAWLRSHFVHRYPELDTKKTAQRVLLPDLWPSLTVTSLPDDIVHFRDDRIPTVREIARLQTFPDWFEFRGVRTTGFERRRAGIFVPQYTQAANAVPPRLAHAVAARIRDFLLKLEEDPSCSWEAGRGIDGSYDVNVNALGSAARTKLDALNLAFETMASSRDRG